MVSASQITYGVSLPTVSDYQQSQITNNLRLPTVSRWQNTKEMPQLAFDLFIPKLNDDPNSNPP